MAPATGRHFVCSVARQARTHGERGNALGSIATIRANST